MWSEDNKILLQHKKAFKARPKKAFNVPKTIRDVLCITVYA